MRKTPVLIQHPRAGGRHCKLWPGGLYDSYERDVGINVREGSFDWKVKVLAHFLLVKRYPRATSPLPRIFSPNPSDKNFEIAILLKIGHWSYKKNSNVETTPRSRGEAF